MKNTSLVKVTERFVIVC